ncbi:hypothetical protein I7E32_16150 [Alcaligenes faecalis]|uniref:hypothetical protein n=1 Tax=Alcaligenes faecalis TaxID=511 RepID=UPI0018D11927|nr:hypothetical protein [Alcaligenes faecalis]MBH0311904.1 hypothetical protein [Alcaligenes faecalis]
MNYSYFIYIMIILVCLIFLFIGIKNKKKCQIVLSIFAAVLVSMVLYFEIEDVKARELSDNIAKTKESNKIEADKTSQTDKELKDYSKPTGENIKHFISKDERDDVLDVQYSDLGEDKIAVIKMNLPANFSNRDTLKSGFIKAKNVIKSVDSQYRESITKYDFWFVGDVVDSNGDKEQQKLLSFEYLRNDINNIDLKYITNDDFVGFAKKTYIHPAFSN